MGPVPVAMLRLLLVCLVAGRAWAGWTAEAPLQTARQILDLPQAEALRGRPVRLIATVLLYDAETRCLYVNDLTAGIRVRVELTEPLPPKVMVEIAGRTGHGFSPEIMADRVTPLPVHSPLRLGSSLRPSAITDYRHDGQWVYMIGQVRDPERRNGRLHFNFRERNTTVPIVVIDPSGVPDESGLHGESASLRGVAVTVTNQSTGRLELQVLVPRVQGYNPDENYLSFSNRALYRDLPPNAAADLKRVVTQPALARDNTNHHWTLRYMAVELLSYGFTLRPGHVQGVILHAGSPRHYVLADDTGSVTLQLARSNSLAPGDLVKANGTVQAGRTLPHLLAAEVEVLGRAPLPEPVVIHEITPETFKLEGRRVRLTGKVTGHDHRWGGLATNEVLLVQLRDRTFEVHLPPGTEGRRRYPPNTTARFTGVCDSEMDARNNPTSLRLLINDPGDVTVLAVAPLVLPETMRSALVAASALAGVGLLAALWIVLLRVQVHRRTREIQAANASLRAEVNAREHAEQEARAALAKERELVQLKSNFVSMVSHEFRTPLGVIQSSSDILDRYHERLPAEKREAQLRSIRKAVRRMSELMEEVLQLARLDNDQVRCRREPTEVTRLCRRCLADVATSTADKCRLDLLATPAAFRADIDENLVVQVLVNLLGNAVKYSPPGTSVTLRVTASRDRLVLEVADQGCGIPAADLPRLFTGFYRGGNIGATPGSGLGLLIVKRCLDLHGGRVDISSTEGRGTTVRVEIPLGHFEPVEPDAGADTDLARRSGSGHTAFLARPTAAGDAPSPALNDPNPAPAHGHDPDH